MILKVDFSSKLDKERLYNVLKGLKSIPYLIELRVNRNNRSIPQNKFYWGVVINILSNHTGFEPEEVHEVLRAKFLKYRTVVFEEEIEVTKSTKNLDTKEFEEYLEKIRMFAAQELDVQIPLPNEVIETKL
jgi:hypothetical protein